MTSSNGCVSKGSRKVEETAGNIDARSLCQCVRNEHPVRNEKNANLGFRQ